MLVLLAWLPCAAAVATQGQIQHSVFCRSAFRQPGAGVHRGALTKAGIADQLRAVFAIHDQVRARVSVDDVRMVGELAWVYSTGDVTGRLRWVGGSVPVLSWQRELEVARRENGRWRLYGYQQ